MRQVNGTEALVRVRRMRSAATDAERLLWAKLRGRGLADLKFRRQVWLGAYIADFLCIEAKLIVELDGSQHGDAIAYDRTREEVLANAGYRTLRFWNDDVSGNMDRVLEAIRSACLERVPSPSHAARGPLPLPTGEGR